MKKEQYFEQLLDMFQQGIFTRQDIARALNISMPTVLQLVNELMDKGVLVEAGSMESTGGRKAKGLMLNKEAAYVLGINIGLSHVSAVLLNYNGEAVNSIKYATVFNDSNSWYDELKNRLCSFVTDECGVDFNKVICAGVSFPGIIDDYGGWIIHSHVFRMHNIGLDRFRRMFTFPVAVFNDANSGGYTEINYYGDSYVYLSLNESVGGAIILDGRIYAGDTYHAGEVGHTLLIPGGKTCYCGKKGCADAYVTSNVLTKDCGSVFDFIKKVEAGEAEACRLWDEYLEKLAILVTNLRMVFNNKIIIGGDVGRIIDPYMPELCNKMRENDLFARDIDYVFACRTKENINAIGAGRLALAKHRRLVI